MARVKTSREEVVSRLKKLAGYDRGEEEWDDEMSVNEINSIADMVMDIQNDRDAVVAKYVEDFTTPRANNGDEPEGDIQQNEDPIKLEDYVNV